MPTANIQGAEIYYHEIGNGPAVILSAGGLQGKGDSYSDVMEDLAQEHRVITYDRRFGGQSDSPLVVQTWDMACQDVFDLMDALDIDKAYLGGGSFGAAISFGCASRDPERVKGIFPSNIAGGVICNAYLAAKLFKSLNLALETPYGQGIKIAIDSFDLDDRFSPFSPERAQYDEDYRKSLEAMDPEDFAQVMRATINALFDGPYISLGMTKNALKTVRVPTIIMPGHNDIHPRTIAEEVHRLVPNAQWGEVKPHSEEPQKYARRVVEFLSSVEDQPK